MFASLSLPDCSYTDTSVGQSSRGKRPTRNFTGASKRRLKMLLASGIDFKEALELCKNPISQAVLPTDETHNMQSKSCEEISKVQISPAIKVGVKDTQLLTSDKLDRLKSAMLKQITKGPPTINRPDFLNCTKKEGWLCITCTNEGAKKWLYEIAPRLKPWPEARITCMSEEDFPKACVGLAWIPGPKIETSWLLYSLHVWNKGLDAILWRVLNSKKLKCGQIVTFSIPVSSYEYLQKENFIAQLGLGQIKIRFKKKTIPRTQKVA